MIFKSCKLIPVMIGGIVIQHKRYGVIDFCAALLMCIGLVLFTLADVTVSPQYEPMGKERSARESALPLTPWYIVTTT